MNSRYGSIVRIKEGKYRVYWGTGRESDGTRRRESVTVYGSRKDAETVLAQKAAQGFKVSDAVNLWPICWGNIYLARVLARDRLRTTKKSPRKRGGNVSAAFSASKESTRRFSKR